MAFLKIKNLVDLLSTKLSSVSFVLKVKQLRTSSKWARYAIGLIHPITAPESLRNKIRVLAGSGSFMARGSLGEDSKSEWGTSNSAREGQASVLQEWIKLQVTAYWARLQDVQGSQHSYRLGYETSLKALAPPKWHISSDSQEQPEASLWLAPKWLDPRQHHVSEPIWDTAGCTGGSETDGDHGSSWVRQG